MKNAIKYTAIITLVSLGTFPTWADQTNLVRNLEINLTGIQQGGATTVKNVTTTTLDKVKLDTSDIISALGAATGNTFSSNAQLVVIEPLPGGADSIEIRDGDVSVGVTGCFPQSYLSDLVGKSTVNNRTGKASGSSYGIQQFTLQDYVLFQPLTLHYVVSGVTVENFTIPAIPGPRREMSADVSGAGDVDGKLVILQGTIRIFGQSIELVPGGGPPT